MSLRSPEVRSLRFYSFQSLLLHASFFAIALFIAKLTWDSLEQRRAENIQLVQSSVRVDVVAMPELTVKELKTFEQQEEVEVVPAPVEKAPEPEAKPDQPEFIEEKKKQDFASMLKNLSQKKVEEKPTKKVEKKQNVFDRAKIQKLVAAGNKISGGSALIGGSGEAAQGEYAQYLGAMPEAVKPYWKLPSYLASQELQARVRVFLRADGSLIKAELYESSGVTEYDQRAMEAVRRAKFAPMPKGYSNRGVAGEIVLGFPL